IATEWQRRRVGRGARVPALSPPGRAPAPPRGRAERWRAADAGDRPRADEQPGPPADGRAVRRAGAATPPAARRTAPRAEAVRAGDPPGRAKPRPGAEARRRGLRARPGPDRLRWHSPGARRRPYRQTALPGRRRRDRSRALR